MSFTNIYPITCFKCSSPKVNVFLTKFASRITKLFLSINELRVKYASLNAYSSRESINLILIFSIKISILYRSLLIIFLKYPLSV